MYYMRSLSIILAGLLGGCGTWYEWTRPDPGRASLIQDGRECRAVAQFQGDSDQSYERCMRDRGYVMVQKMEWLLPVRDR